MKLLLGIVIQLPTKNMRNKRKTKKEQTSFALRSASPSLWERYQAMHPFLPTPLHALHPTDVHFHPSSTLLFFSSPLEGVLVDGRCSALSVKLCRCQVCHVFRCQDSFFFFFFPFFSLFLFGALRRLICPSWVYSDGFSREHMESFAAFHFQLDICSKKKKKKKRENHKSITKRGLVFSSSRESSIEVMRGVSKSPRRSPRMKPEVQTRSRSSSFDCPPANLLSPRSSQVSIFSVLSTPALKEAFKWYCVSVFAFENLFFIDKVDLVWRPLFQSEKDKKSSLRKSADPSSSNKEEEEREAQRRTQERLEVASQIVSTFLSDDAAWEVTLPAGLKKNLCEAIAKAKSSSSTNELGVSLFDNAYDTVMRDITRSLTQFQVTEVYASYMLNKDWIEPLYSQKSRSTGEGASAETLTRIRHLYKTKLPVRLVPLPDGGKSNKQGYTHACMVGEDLRGHALRSDATYEFYSLDNVLLTSLPTNQLEQAAPMTGRARAQTAPALAGPVFAARSPSVAAPAAPASSSKGSVSAAADRKASVGAKKRFGLFSRASRSTSAALSEPAIPVVTSPPTDFVDMWVVNEAGRIIGPIPTAQMRVLWKFHLLHSWLTVSLDEGKNTCVLSELEHAGFGETNRVQMADPTRVKF